MNLQPRTKPVEVEERKPESSEPKPQKPPAASIFGSAKPVDTAQREREIEEKLLRQKQEGLQNKSSLESRGYGSSKGFEETPSREKKRHDSSDNKENRNV